jgi:pimeloyl-ACP methyl ester carboxylesterase
MLELQRGTVSVGRDARIAYVIDDYVDGWQPADTILLLHGIAESAQALKAWVPALARRFRVVRVDLRGYGDSSPIEDDGTNWIPRMADDIEALISHRRLGRVHLAGAKLGALVGLDLAQRRLPQLASLTLAGVLIAPSRAVGDWTAGWIDLIDREGVEAWARVTMAGRMGNTLSPQALAWWSTYMGQAPAESVKACLRMLPGIAEPANLERIACPTQVIVAVKPTGSRQFNQQQSVQEVRRWQQRIPDSRLHPLEADSYHIAATHPDACAKQTLAFIESLSTRSPQR